MIKKFISAFVLLLLTIPICCVQTYNKKHYEPTEMYALVSLLNIDGESPTEAQDCRKVIVEKSNVIHNCEITYYCNENYPHICNNGDATHTKTGEPTIPNLTCAVDPDVIPLYSTVLIDFGDGELHTYHATDIGGAINGNHVDICVSTHEEALKNGVDYATVYWEE